MDPFGNHAITCHGGIAARKATLLEYALERAFRKLVESLIDNLLQHVYLVTLCQNKTSLHSSLED
jgi:hypothetical protein